MAEPIELDDGLVLRFDNRLWRVTRRSIDCAVLTEENENGEWVSARVEDEHVSVTAVPA